MTSSTSSIPANLSTPFTSALYFAYRSYLLSSRLLAAELPTAGAHPQRPLCGCRAVAGVRVALAQGGQ